MIRRFQKRNFLVLPMLMAFVTIVLLAFGSSLFTTPTLIYFDQISTGWSVYRGDEFVVVLTGEKKALAKELLGKLDGLLEDLNKKDSSINRSAASGFACSDETDSTEWNEVYLLADERMYRKKALMK